MHQPHSTVNADCMRILRMEQKHEVIAPSFSGKLINRLVTPVPSELAYGSQAIDERMQTERLWILLNRAPVRMAQSTEVYRD